MARAPRVPADRPPPRDPRLCHSGPVARWCRFRSAGFALGLAAALSLGAVPLVAGASAPGAATSAVAPSASPPVPAGTTQRAVLAPRAYPGGGLFSFGLTAPAPAMPTTLDTVVVSATSTRSGDGMWLVSADGGVYNAGDAPFEGSLGSLHLDGPVVAMAGTADDRGYWLAALDGGVFALGDARFYGSMGGVRLDQPIVGMAATPTGEGYWLVASDGGVFAFGDARYVGGRGGQSLNSPIVGMAATPTGKGYWLVAGDGGIFAYGDARFLGSTGGVPLNAPIAGMAATADGGGYWLVGSDGGVFTFGDADFHGSLGTSPTATPVAAIVPSAGGAGYWLVEPDGWDYTFANPPPNGTFPGSNAIVAAAGSQVRPDPSTANFCNPYGPCEEWCALFATWAVQSGGIPIPSYAFTGGIWTWGAQRGLTLPPTATPVPGDVVLYGTGPSSTSTSVHTGIVAQVWPDGAVLTIEGDAGPGVSGHLAVVINGPFLVADSASYNGVGVYGFVRP